ncbi:HxsD-like protein [Bacteroidota bacterium]
MSNIKVDEKKFVVNLNNKFYTSEVIERGVKDFVDVAKITMNQKGEVTIKPKDKKNPEEIGYEFCDYLLSIIHGGDFA